MNIFILVCIGATNAQEDTDQDQDLYQDLLRHGVWKRPMEDVLDEEGEDDDSNDEMVPGKDIKMGGVETVEGLLPFYSYRQILKNQRWKKSLDMYRPAYGFGKRSPEFHFSMATPYKYYTKFMANPYGSSFYEM